MEGGSYPAVVVLLKPLLGDKKVHVFPKGISPNMNVIARLEFELAYYDVAVHHISLSPNKDSPLAKYIEAYVLLRLNMFYQRQKGLECH